MIGRIVSAAVGKKLAERYGDGTKGLIIGALAPTLVRRAFGPLGLAVAGGYAAKKLYDARKAKRRGTPGA